MHTKGLKTRQNIIERSLQLFSVKGYFNTSITDILDATGLTKGGLYGHFASKEDIWYAVYDRAVEIWRQSVFEGAAEIHDPIERIKKVIENNMAHYLGREVFSGGCFFFNMLVELSGQSHRMNQQILRGFVRFSRLMQQWLKEAEEKGLIEKDLNHREIANFIVISVNGAAPLFSASRDHRIWQQTISQLHHYMDQFRRINHDDTF